MSLESWFLPLLVFLPAFGAMTVLLFGHFAQTNALRLHFDSHVQLGAGSTFPLAINHGYGYLGELNHGFFYLFVAPAFVYVVWSFLRSASDAFGVLEHHGRLESIGGRGRVRDYVARRNRAVFKRVPIFATLFFVLFDFTSETISLIHNNRGTDLVLGYIQAPVKQKWMSAFAKASSAEQCKSFISARLRGELERTLRDKLEQLDWAASSPEWQALIKVGGSVETSDEKSLANWLKAGTFDLDLQKAMEGGLVRLTATITGGPETPAERRWYWAFFFSLILLEASFHGFLLWSCLKVLFWCRLFYEMLPGRSSSKQAFRLRPRYNDEGKRYGLGELHEAYNWVMAMDVICAFAFSLNFMANSAKHTWLTDSAFSLFAVGQIFILLSVAISFLALLLGPVWLFGRRMQSSKKRHLRKLDAMMVEAKHDERRQEELTKEIGLAETQTTWPKNDEFFRKLVLTSGAFVLLPWFFIAQGSSEDTAGVQKYINVLRHLEGGTDWLCRKIYPEV